MPTSPYAHIEYVVFLLAELRPASILDIGLGNGKIGFMARDVLDVMLNESYLKKDWKVIIDGIEVCEDYIQDHQRFIYNNIYIGDAYSVIDRLGSYHTVILGDVLEHFEKDRAWLFLDKCALHAETAIIINIPLGYVPQPAIYGNEYETHRSSWQADDFAAFTEQMRLFTLTNSMGYGTFLINKDKYLLSRSEAVFKEANDKRIKGNTDDAIIAYLYASVLNPNTAEIYNNLGAVYADRGEINKALSCFNKAVALNPQSAISHFNMANSSRDCGNILQAIEHYLRAIEIDPHFYDAAYNLGNLYQTLGLYIEALTAFDMTITMNGQFASAYCNKGAVLYLMGEFDAAIELYKKAVDLSPEHAEAHWNLSLALLLKGDFARGWQEYEWRWKTKDYSAPEMAMPLWDGSSEGSSILIFTEQGIGDSIHFSRYLPLLKEKGFKIFLQCHKETRSLFRGMTCIEGVITHEEPSVICDYYCPIMTLPLLFRTDWDSIPSNVPYITAQDCFIDKWRSRLMLDERLKVGIVWAGKPEYRNDKNRSIPLSTFAPLFEIEGVDFYSLQKGHASRQSSQYSQIIDMTEEIDDFSDTAGFISNLDMIISVDTATAHLTGAMAKPLWILLPYTPDWRWMLNRSDSPWYPTARLFRQKVFGRWEDVIQEVKAALVKETDRKAGDCPPS